MCYDNFDLQKLQQVGDQNKPPAVSLQQQRKLPVNGSSREPPFPVVQGDDDELVVPMTMEEDDNNMPDITTEEMPDDLLDDSGVYF